MTSYTLHTQALLVTPSCVIHNFVQIYADAEEELFVEWPYPDRVPNKVKTTLDEDKVYAPNTVHEGAIGM